MNCREKVQFGISIYIYIHVCMYLYVCICILYIKVFPNDVIPSLIVGPPPGPGRPTCGDGVSIAQLITLPPFETVLDHGRVRCIRRRVVVGALRGGGGSALTVRAAHALHDKGPGRGSVEGAQLVVAEPFGHQPGAEGDEGEDDDGEADGRDGLGDGKGGAEGEQLDGHKRPDGGSAFQPGQSVVGVGEFAISREE